MKKIFSLLILMMAIASTMIAQQVPQGMKYQAVARNLKGEILADEKIVLKISLTSQEGKSAVVHYSELHNVKTNELGLFTLVIGDGVSNNAAFKEIPWSSQNIWMEVSIADKIKGGFTVISSSKLLAVPYAFHAETANRVVDGKTNLGITAKIPGGGSGGGDGTDAQVWQLFGNVGTTPTIDKLGTTDDKDIRIVTNNIERMRVLSNGNITMVNDLTVGNNVYLNTTSGGATVNNGNFTVANMSTTNLSGTLTVDKATNLNDILNVNNEKSTYLSGSLTADKLIRFTDGTQSNSTATGALVVTGGVGIGKNLFIGGTANFGSNTDFRGIVHVTNLTQSTLPTDGALIVDGGAGFGKNLNVGGALNVTNGMAAKSLTITDNVPNGNYLATFTNTNTSGGGNDEGGDGIKIKLGRTHPTWDGSAYANIQNTYVELIQQPIDFVNNVLIDKTEEFTVVGLFQAFPTSLFSAGLAALTNAITSEINDALDLPNTIIPETDLLLSILQSINGTDACEGGSCTSPGDCLIPDELICPEEDDYVGGQLVFPAVTIPAIPQINTAGLPSFSLFNVEFTNVPNSLTKNNEFIVFTDKDDKKLGSIRAQSINNFRADYIDGAYIINLVAQFVKIDVMNAIISVVNEASQIVDAYNSIGVEYSSGHGDYAEWLERLNADENIGTGDIVAIKGGKITKNLKGAEQIMAISYRPIVLGNVPEAQRVNLGNNVAFMGQIPVKVVGPVHAGDYIVAKSSIEGYGVAVNPLNMRIEDYKLSVGRSWTTNRENGPKLVTTVVGVHNSDFLNIIKSLKEHVDANESRLKAIEEKLNISSKGFDNQTEKKAFK